MIEIVEESIQSVTLAKQFAATAGMTVIITVVHALGLTAISKVLHLNKERLNEMSFSFKSISLLSAMGLCLIGLHTVEIAIFAAFYLLIGSVGTAEEALYFSASNYATLGRTAEYFPADWRLMGAMEAMIGFLLIGWSTAFIVSKGNRLMPD